MKGGPNDFPWDSRILQILSGPRSMSEIQDEIGCSYTAAWSHVASLRRRGLLRRYRRGLPGPPPGGSRVWYSLTLAGRNAVETLP